MRAVGNARRSAAATGMAWTMSPSAPSRTIRTGHVGDLADRGAGLPTSARQAGEQIPGGMVFLVADDGRSSAVGLDDRALGNRVDGVVGALAVHVRLQQPQQPFDGRIGEHDHVVDAAQGRHELGAFCCGHHRTRPGPFNAATERSSLTATIRRSASRLRPADSGRGRRAAGRSSRSRTRSSAPRRDRAPTASTSSALRQDQQRPILFAVLAVLGSSRFSRFSAPAPVLPGTMAQKRYRGRCHGVASSLAETVAVPRFITTSPPA